MDVAKMILMQIAEDFTDRMIPIAGASYIAAASGRATWNHGTAVIMLINGERVAVTANYIDEDAVKELRQEAEGG